MSVSTFTSHSTIFKTFDSTIDKWSAKIGVFGKSFYNIIETANQRKIEINDLITYNGLSLNEAKSQVGSLWSKLFPSTKNLASQIINIDSELPEFDTNMARQELENLQRIQNQINLTNGSWDDYNGQFTNGKKYLLNYAKQNNILEASVDDVKNANKAARASALAHNEAIKSQTFSAKAGTAALKALSVAGNMVAMWAISQLIQGAVKAWDYFNVTVEESKEKVDSMTSSSLSELNDEIQTLTEKSELTDIEKKRLKYLEKRAKMEERLRADTSITTNNAIIVSSQTSRNNSTSSEIPVAKSDGTPPSSKLWYIVNALTGEILSKVYASP